MMPLPCEHNNTKIMIGYFVNLLFMNHERKANEIKYYNVESIDEKWNRRSEGISYKYLFANFDASRPSFSKFPAVGNHVWM